MTEDELKKRLKAFAVRIIKMVDKMPNTVSSRALASQIVRSGTSPSANYRAACISKSPKDFLNKLKMVEEELDETMHWLEIISESEILPEHRLQPLYIENKELLSIIIKSIVTTRKSLGNKTGKNIPNQSIS